MIDLSWNKELLSPLDSYYSPPNLILKKGNSEENWYPESENEMCFCRLTAIFVCFSILFFVFSVNYLIELCCIGQQWALDNNGHSCCSFSNLVTRIFWSLPCFSPFSFFGSSLVSHLSLLSWQRQRRSLRPRPKQAGVCVQPNLLIRIRRNTGVTFLWLYENQNLNKIKSNIINGICRIKKKKKRNMTLTHSECVWYRYKNRG